MKAIDIIDNNEGWMTLPSITERDIKVIQSAILESYNKNIASFFNSTDSRIVDSFSKLAEYHESELGTTYHSKAWPKLSRIVSKDNAHSIREIFRDHLSLYFRDFTISDEEELGYPNIYWRLVRPNKEEDVGDIHKDKWFWDINTNQVMPVGKTKRYKIWIPLISDTLKNTLEFVSFSQLNPNIRWAKKKKNNQEKPILIDRHYIEEVECSNCRNNFPILFHDEILHRGPVYRGKSSRVSIEFTLCVSEKDIL